MTRFFRKLFLKGGDLLGRAIGRSDRRGVVLKAFMASLLLGLTIHFFGTLGEYQEEAVALQKGEITESLSSLPSIIPLVWQGLSVILAVVALLVSFWVRENTSAVGRRGTLIITTLWIASFAILAAWLPTDVIVTQRALSGQALAGETPSIAAYFGKLFFISILILSIPAAAMVYFRLSLMDRYVIHSFLSPFSFCIFSFIAIWVIADFTDNGGEFSGLAITRMMEFYVIQFPFVLLFVMPIAMLLSGLMALSKMSKSNEFISMIGAGRSVVRILAPLLIIGAYASLICVAFKYEWAPTSVGYKEAIMEAAKAESWAIRQGTEVPEKDIWAKRGWMHIDEVSNRTWFVGKVPLKLSDPMADLVILQLDDKDQPEVIWIAKTAKWAWNTEPPQWIFKDVRIYEYDDKNIPRITSTEELILKDWGETPWKVLSSSQNAEYLGIPGLTMYLNANQDMNETALAAFRTNFWYIFAEPVTCLVMILVAAPLGIVYSRRGVMGGVTMAIGLFALMYIMRGTFISLGQLNRIHPFLAAWGTNFFIGGIGLYLLWYRARNRDVPKFKGALKRMFRSRKSVA